MSERMVSNHSDSPMYVGGKMIPPGESRLVGGLHPADPVPQTAASAAESVPQVPPDAGAAPADDLIGLLDATIPAITKAIQQRNEQSQPVIPDADLDRLWTAEEGGKTRKGVMAAIEAEKLARASERAAAEEQAAQEIDAFAALLREMSDEELSGEREKFADDPSMLAVVESVIEERARTAAPETAGA